MTAEAQHLTWPRAQCCVRHHLGVIRCCVSVVGCCDSAQARQCQGCFGQLGFLSATAPCCEKCHMIPDSNFFFLAKRFLYSRACGQRDMTSSHPLRRWCFICGPVTTDRALARMSKTTFISAHVRLLEQLLSLAVGSSLRRLLQGQQERRISRGMSGRRRCI